jgi:hypothetical protein
MLSTGYIAVYFAISWMASTYLSDNSRFQLQRCATLQLNGCFGSPISSRTPIV